MFASLLVGLLAACATHVTGHTYHLGDCPRVDGVPDFDVKQFLGKWYVLQKTSTGSGCLVNNYTVNPDKPGQYKIEQISEHFLLGLTSVDHKYHYTGDLTLPEGSNTGAMKVRFPLNVAGGASYTVFMTDYKTYAGVFTCQKLAFAHRQSATILSRTANMDKAYIDKIRSRLSSYGVDPFSLSIIKQENCTEASEDTANININGGTFSSESVAGAVRKAGEKLGDGVEAIGEGAKKLYNKVRGDHDSKEDLSEDRDMKSDAEWLP